ncbi:hypothetical protein R5W24_000744 [Gemmata sp. JC717]|uniref:sigma-70 family RNA polymerase sigma factor n=1 Tax=Gemmata algarum TaxID=2975278 RepID=UPI0021BBB512|nr:hypothetical protein [Gemmata algarum]MDY3551665.1 hypothetical protein [Gemmata algarum]
MASSTAHDVAAKHFSDHWPRSARAIELHVCSKWEIPLTAVNGEWAEHSESVFDRVRAELTKLHKAGNPLPIGREFEMLVCCHVDDVLLSVSVGGAARATLQKIPFRNDESRHSTLNDVIVRVLKKKQSWLSRTFYTPTAFSNFVKTVANRAAIDRRMKRARQRVESLLTGEEGSVLDPADPNVTGPQEHAEASELKGVIAAAIEELDDIYRPIIYARLNGLRPCDAASELGITEEVARARYIRACKQIRSRLRQAGFLTPRADCNREHE